MKMAFYLGGYGTEPDRTIRALMQNRDWMLEHGIEPVPPARQRGLFAEALATLDGATASPQMETVLTEAILDGSVPDRVICAQPSILGTVAQCLGRDGFFMNAGRRMAAAAGLFPSSEAEFYLALRNPATLVPWMLSQLPADEAASLMDRRDPATMRWAPAMRQAVSALAGRPLVIWCHEDTPLIWPEVIRRIATMPADIPLRGGLGLLSDLLTAQGMTQLQAELAAESRLTVAHRREIFTRALTTHARPEAIETTINLPGWDQALVDRMTHDYAQDVAEIAALPGVEFLTP